MSSPVKCLKCSGGAARDYQPHRHFSLPTRSKTRHCKVRERLYPNNNMHRFQQPPRQGGSSGQGQRSFESKGLKELLVTGWEKSKAASTSNDGGVGDLVSFIERKGTQAKDKHAAGRGLPAGQPVRVRKRRVDGPVLHIFVVAEDFPSVVRLDGWQFAGINLVIKEATSRSPSPANGHRNNTNSFPNAPRGPSGQHQRGPPRTSTPSNAPREPVVPTGNVKQLLQNVLESRYNQNDKLLNLTALGQDAEVQSAGFFADKRTESKFFPALMKILDHAFGSEEEKAEAIHSVVLSNNSLDSLRPITTIAPTLPGIKNLDLSNNQLMTVDDLRFWKNKFTKLDHLVVTGNPLEQNQPNYAQEIMRMYPTLRFLNGQQVRSDAEAAAVPPPQTRNAPMKDVARPAPPGAAPAGGAGTSQEEQMIAEVMKQTGMNATYARFCLESAGWDWDKAGELFQQQRATLPPEAFQP